MQEILSTFFFGCYGTNIFDKKTPYQYTYSVYLLPCSMPIENPNMDNKPEKINPSKEQKDAFSETEQKLIDDYTKLKNYETIDPKNMTAETKKV